MIARCGDARKDVTHLWLVIDKLQQRLPARAALADTKNVLCGRIQSGNQQVFVKKDNSRTQCVENRAGV
jgi:hypothetical protein